VPEFRLPKIYPITDPEISGLTHCEQVELLIAGGAKIIQLRDKDANPRDFYTSAKYALDAARKHHVPLIINDRVDIALALRADGVHLGQDDLPPDKARLILGDAAIIGFSTHSVEQAARAAKFPVDYIAIGPIFTTRSKRDPDAEVGLRGIEKVRQAIGTMPLVAIGGITGETLASVLAAGADSAAIIGAILADPALIEDRMAEMRRIAGDIE